MRNAAPTIVDTMEPNNFSALYLSYSLGKARGYRSQVDRDASFAIWFLTPKVQKVHVIVVFLSISLWLALTSDTRPVVLTMCITSWCLFKGMPDSG